MTTMLGSYRVVSQIDDDFLRRLVHGLDEALESAFIDGDLFIAYQEVKKKFQEAYPDLYGDEGEGE